MRTRPFFSDSQVENIFFDLKSKIFDLSSRKFSNLQSLPVLFRWQFSLSRKILPTFFDLKPKTKQIRLGKSKIFANIFDLKSKISNFRLGKSKIVADFFCRQAETKIKTMAHPENLRIGYLRLEKCPTQSF